MPPLLVAFSSSNPKTSHSALPGLRRGQAFSFCAILNEAIHRCFFLSSFLYFVCDAEHLRLSLIRPSLPIEFTWPSAPLITPPPTSPAVFVGPPFVTPHQPHARVHNCSTPNLQLSCFTPSLPADLVTCLTSSRLRFCWLWWRPEYLPRMPFSAAMANCVLQIYRVAPVRPCHPTNAEKSS
jgi:hypothetical protein